MLPALRALAVPVCVITDFDLLRGWTELSNVYELLGGNAADLEALWKSVNSQLLDSGDKRTVSQLRADLDVVLASANPGDKYSKGLHDALSPIIKFKSGWDQAKSQGLVALKSNAHSDGVALLAHLRERGLLVCPFGELEAFHRGVSGHGAQWVGQGIATEVYKSLAGPERDFISGIAASSKA